MRLTPQLLREATGCSPAAAELYAETLADAMSTFGIDSPEQIAAFLAQIGHESGSLRHVREGWGPTRAAEASATRSPATGGATSAEVPCRSPAAPGTPRRAIDCASGSVTPPRTSRLRQTRPSARAGRP